MRSTRARRSARLARRGRRPQASPTPGGVGAETAGDEGLSPFSAGVPVPRAGGQRSKPTAPFAREPTPRAGSSRRNRPRAARSRVPGFGRVPSVSAGDISHLNLGSGSHFFRDYDVSWRACRQEVSHDPKGGLCRDQVACAARCLSERHRPRTGGASPDGQSGAEAEGGA